MNVTEATRAWLPLRGGAELTGLPLFCLPHAGGAASAFRTWIGTLPGVDVLPVQPPGREGRMRESPYTTFDPLVDQIVALIEQVAGERDYALYGHSLGSLVAFETVRELRRCGLRLPVRLIVSGAPAPQKSHNRGKQVSTMATPELVAMLRELGGTPEWVLADPELVEMVLPVIRADFALRESYRYEREPQLDLPISVIASDHDSRAPRRQQVKWKDQSTQPAHLAMLTGGHFAIFERTEEMREHLMTALSSWCLGS